MKSSINYFDGLKLLNDSIHLGRTDLALQTIQEMDKLSDLEISQKLNRDVVKAKILLEVGDSEEALGILEQSITHPRLKEDIILFAKAKVVQVNAHVMFGDINKAKLIIEDLKRIFDKMSDNEKEQSEDVRADMAQTMGLIHNKQGELDLALDYYKQSLNICKKLNFRKEMGLLNFNIASIYKLQNNLDLGLTYFEQAGGLFREIEYYDAEATTLRNIEEIHRIKGDDDLAFVYKQKKENLSDKVKLRKLQLEASKVKNNLDRKLEKLNAENIELKQQMWSYKFEIESAESASDETKTLPSTMLQNTTEELETTKTELEKIRILYDGVKGSLSDVTSQKKELESTKAELEKIRILYDGVKGSLSDGTSQKKELETTKTELEKIRILYEGVRVSLIDETSQKNELENRLNSILEEHDPVSKDELEEMREIISTNKNEIVKLSSTNERLNIQKNENEKKILLLEDKIKDFEKDKKHFTSMRSEIDKINAEKSSFLKEVHSLKERSQNLENELNIKNEIIEKTLKSQQIGKQNEKIQYEKEIAGYKEKLYHLTDTEERFDVQTKEFDMATEKINKLKSTLEEFQNKFDDLTTIPQDGKEVAKPSQVTPLKREKVVLKPTPIHKSVLPTKSQLAVHTRGFPGTIDDFLNKDRLAKRIADILKDRPRILLRMLSMQLGSSPAKILDTVKNLESKGYIVLNYAHREDSNPEISLAR